MTMYRAVLLGAALVTGSVTGASAADLYGRGGSIKDGYGPIQMYSGPASWYIRADVGYARNDHPSVVEGSRYDLTGAAIDDQWSAGLGIGRYFGKNVRGDITWDYRFETDARGSNVAVGLNFPGERSFGLRSNVVLANLYYDFDLRSRFTPYIGIGIGLAYNETTGGTVPDNCACGFTDVSISGDSRWSVAGALMTGFSLAMRERLHLDAGYRYLYLGEAKTGAISGTTAAPALASDGDLQVRDIFAHEFRVGLRYDIR
jgi:opacity protein-like surface antigen